jgi:alpha-mannosidase
VRFYEGERSRGPVTVQAAFKLKAAHVTNLLEENQEQLAVDGNRVRLNVRPYQIVTLRLVPA